MKKHPAMLNLADEKLLAHRAAMLQEEAECMHSKDDSLLTEQVLFEGKKDNSVDMSMVHGCDVSLMCAVCATDRLSARLVPQGPQ
jgi:hypothetical protein